MIDVLIVGAGPTGLTLAILCNRLGLSYRIIDQNSGPAIESRALGIQARTMEFFHKLGIVNEFLKYGMKAKGVKLFLNGKKRLEIDIQDMERRDTLFPFIFFMPQSKTERILLKEVGSVERNTKLISFKDKTDHVNAIITNFNGDSETITAQFLCGCDGSHSTVRKGLNLDFEGDAYASEFLMADCKVDWQEDHKTLKVFLDSGKLGVFFPLQHSQLSRVLTIAEVVKNNQPATTATTAFTGSLSELERQFKDASHMEMKLSNPAWVTRYHVHHRSVRRMREGNVFLLGDAAHIHSPVGAQGMNTGIQDANNLAWKLKLAINNPHEAYELLETFNDERLPVAKHLLSYTDRIFSAATSKNKWFLGIRNLALPVVTKTLMRIPQGRRKLFNFISQLNIHYHPNMIVKANSGIRAPNANLDSGLTVHDLLKGYDFHVIVLKKEGFTPNEVREINHNVESLGIKNIHLIRQVEENDGCSIKAELNVFRTYNVDEQALYIVRPDGYIGYHSGDILTKPDYPAFHIPLINMALGKEFKTWNYSGLQNEM